MSEYDFLHAIKKYSKSDENIEKEVFGLYDYFHDYFMKLDPDFDKLLALCTEKNDQNYK